MTVPSARASPLQSLEKGGKSGEVPARLDLDEWIAAYLHEAVLTGAALASPLYRTPERRGSSLTGRAMSSLAMQLMHKRRLKAAKPPKILSPHPVRILVVTDLTSQDVPREDIRYLAGHAHPHTTQIYARRGDCPPSPFLAVFHLLCCHTCAPPLRLLLYLTII